MTLKNRDRHRSNRCFQPAVRPLELRELLTGTPGYVLQQGIPSGQIGLLAGDYDSTLYDTPSYEAIIDWGDGTTNQNTSPEDNQWMSNIVRIANESFMVTGSHTYGSQGNFTISTTFVSYPFDETTPVLYAASTTSVVVVAPGGDPDGVATIPDREPSVTIDVRPIASQTSQARTTIDFELTPNVGHIVFFPEGYPDPDDSDLPVVSIEASDPAASRVDGDPGQFLISRNGESSGALTVHYTISGTAVSGVDYQPLPGVVTIPDGEPSVTIDIRPIVSQTGQDKTTIHARLTPEMGLVVGNLSHATIDVAGQPPQGSPEDNPTTKYNKIWIARTKNGYINNSSSNEDDTPSIITVYRDGDLSDSVEVEVAIGFSSAASPYKIIGMFGRDSNREISQSHNAFAFSITPSVEVFKRTYSRHQWDTWNIRFSIPANDQLIRLYVLPSDFVDNKNFYFEFYLQKSTSSNPNKFYLNAHSTRAESENIFFASSRFSDERDPTRPLRETAISSIEVPVGSEASVTVASFADHSNQFNQPMDYSATIDWGDGTITIGTIVPTYEHNYAWGYYDVLGTHIYDEPGWFPVKVTIYALIDTKTLVALSTALVSDPLLTVSSPGQLGHDEGASVAVPIIAADADGSALAYAAIGLPDGLSINPETGVISGTIAAGAASRGFYDVTVVVYTDHSIAEMNFRWVVYLAAGGPSVAVKASDWGSSGGYQGIGPIPATFTISRNSGRNPLMVYFKLGGSATLGVDYTYTMPSGLGGGYIDESTGEGYATIPADAPGFPIIITSLLGNDASNKTVELTLMGSNSQFFGGILGYQLPASTIATALITAPATFDVSGEVYYDGLKPVRFALVEVYEIRTIPDPSGAGNINVPFPIGETYTKADGSYTFKTTMPSPSTTGVLARVRPASDPSQPMQTIEVLKFTGQFYFDTKSATVPGPNNPTVTMPTLLIDDSTNNGKAFYVYDAAVTGARFQGSLPTFKQGKTDIIFPSPLPSTPLKRLTSATWDGRLYIQQEDYNKIDTIVHEYGHAVAQDAGFFPRDVSLRGYLEHSLLSDLRNQRGYSAPLLGLAFSEGWADYYSLAAQQFDGKGDGRFRQFSAEDNEYFGETHELGIMKILWDLSDPKNDDRVEFSYGGETGFSAVYRFVSGNNIRTLDQLWKMLERTTPLQPNGVQNVERLADYGAIFAANGAAANTLQTKIGPTAGSIWTANGPIPSFTWDVPPALLTPTGVDPNLLRRFRVLVFDAVGGSYTQSFNSMELPSSRLTVTGNHVSWTPNPDEWQQIATSGAMTKTWVVLGGDRHSITHSIPVPQNTPASSKDLTEIIDTGFYWSDRAFFTVAP